MGEAARRKNLVGDVRRKIGDAAAAVVTEAQDEVKKLELQHRALAREIESLRSDVAAAKAAPAELRRDVRSLAGALQMQTERLDAVSQPAPAPTCAGAARVERYAQETQRQLEQVTLMDFPQRLRWLFTGRLA